MGMDRWTGSKEKAEMVWRERERERERRPGEDCDTERETEWC